jgi:RimJ/RimL family protein N-acetyltransferase
VSVEPDPPFAAPVRIESLDPHDDQAFQAFVRIHRAAESEGPYATAYQAAELRPQLLDATGSTRWNGYLGSRSDGTPVVAGLLSESTADNLDKGEVSVWVAPADRRQGYGSAMTARLLADARRRGRTTLLAMVRSPLHAADDHASRRFPLRHGFTPSTVDIHRVLDLPVDEARLDALIADISSHHPDCTFVDSIGADLGDDLLPSYLELANALMTDAPTGEMDYEPGGVDIVTWRRDQERLRAMGRTMYRTIAVDSGGRAVAHSVLVVPAHDPGQVFQWGTLVARDHRGRRLGLAVKARTLRTVQAAHPDRTVVHTFNASDNIWMIDVNEALGYRPVARCEEFVRTLED